MEWRFVEGFGDCIGDVVILSCCNESKEMLDTVDRDEMVPFIRGTPYRLVLGDDIDALLCASAPILESEEGDGIRKFLAALLIEGCMAVEILIKYRFDRNIGSAMYVRIPIMTQDPLEVAIG